MMPIYFEQDTYPAGSMNLLGLQIGIWLQREALLSRYDHPIIPSSSVLIHATDVVLQKGANHAPKLGEDEVIT